MYNCCYIFFIYPKNIAVILFSPALTVLHVQRLKNASLNKCFGKIERSFEVSNKTWGQLGIWNSAWQRVSFSKVYTLQFLRNWCQNFRRWLKVWSKDHPENRERTKCQLWKGLDPWLDFWRTIQNARRPHCSFRER